MTLRQTIQAAPGRTSELITKLAATSNQALKTRESLFAQLSDELTRYVELEEQHFLPLLRKHSETKDLAADALKGNKDLRASLKKLSDMPKDQDEFLAELDGLNKSFQQHVRNERKELLPAVLKAFNDEEAGALAANIEGAVAEADKAKRDEKREEAALARRQVEKAEKAAAAERAAVRAQKAAQRTSREATEKAVATMARGTASVQDGARQVTENITQRTEQIASDTHDAMNVYSQSSQKILEAASSAKAVSEIYSVWLEWLGSAARINAEASQGLIQCRSLQHVAELQKEFAANAMRNWVEGNVKVLDIAQRNSKQALGRLDGRLGKAVTRSGFPGGGLA
ncbi:hemerythrin domain-containing protein [Aquibium sp. ELW1220]|jgi:hemerythrin-like domain-containing protein|uniref:hemerythrin domain-containing protein n=1 Tax=Aquibium sp. ELW1220 TaxID=2976766 RepID=UPI0025AFC5F4|nr:hemerythrin domain-containing protein [Aquibium sp. ELW1220]MDN2580095.1 hemerythrin domain-containing protein [Aquibium sp. ELW1220]